MARAVATLSLLSLLGLLTSPLVTASPLLSSLWPDYGQELTTCNREWYSFRSLCWTPVPVSVTSLDDAEADLFCGGLNARALHLQRRHFCVKDAERADDRGLEDMLRAELSIKHKRFMGNNGY